MSQNRKYKNKHAGSIDSDEALNIAQGIKQENQTKAQTRIIAQGIRKGIELYKNQQNKKQREFDKFKKKELKNKLNNQNADKSNTHFKQENTPGSRFWLPWGLLILSWLFFVVYFSILG
ncbi:MAG: DUF2956 family protein [Thiohalomonadales bacterium]